MCIGLGAQVDGVAHAAVAGAEFNDLGLKLGRELRDLEAVALAGVDGEDGRPPDIAQHPTRSPGARGWASTT